MKFQSSTEAIAQRMYDAVLISFYRVKILQMLGY